MSFSSSALAAAAFVVTFVASVPASAQTPPLRPGLWELKQVGGNSAEAARVAASLDKLPPAQRAQVEAMMKQRGLGFGANGVNIQMCMTKASMDPSQWEHRQSGCKTDYPSRSNAAWKFHTVCANTTTDGEMVFSSPESYMLNATSTSTRNGQPQTRQVSMQGKFLGTDCGDIKPVDPKN